MLGLGLGLAPVRVRVGGFGLRVTRLSTPPTNPGAPGDDRGDEGGRIVRRRACRRERLCSCYRGAEVGEGVWPCVVWLWSSELACTYGVQESGCAALRNLGCGKSPEARLTLTRILALTLALTL